MISQVISVLGFAGDNYSIINLCTIGKIYIVDIRCSLYICKSNNLCQQIYKIVVILIISVAIPVIPMVAPVISVIPATRATESR